MLSEDVDSRCAIETVAANGVVLVTGEATTEAYVDITQTARDCLLNIGYDNSDLGLDGHSCGVLVALNNQSPDISIGVGSSWEERHGVAVDEYDAQGAGDQGIIFGYASDETPNLMPLPIDFAHRLAERLAWARKSGTLSYLRPDGKTQVSVKYDGVIPVALDTVLISAQHSESASQETLAAELREVVIEPLLERYALETKNMQVLVNPTGRFVIGGPTGDSGLTGRKIIVDTYGGTARNGGGAFSGKDPSKVDRSASYALRHAAKNLVAAGLAKRCELQVAYAIGKARPIGLYVNSFGTGVVEDAKLQEIVSAVFDLRPAAIISRLKLKRPIYSLTTCYGHFGRELDEFTWEKLDFVEPLRAAAAAL
jgi:S-adenosylmethionine synthetase